MPDTLLALEVAIAHGDLAEIATLLDREPDLLEAHFPANVGLTPLMWACRNRRDSVVRELLARGASVDVTNPSEPTGDGGNTALWFTAQGPAEGTVTIAEWLLDRGAQINTPCEHGTTAFHMAVAWVHLDLVQALLSRGADPGLRDERGETALDTARRNFQWCTDQKALEPNAQKFFQRVPRMIAFLERIMA